MWDISIKKIYSKYIFKILTAFIFWSFVYAVIDSVKARKVLVFFANFARGHYHMWFLFMIVPIMKKRMLQTVFFTKILRSILLAESTAVFVYFKKHCIIPIRIIMIFSQYSFGAYLVHVIVIKFLNRMSLNTLSFNPISFCSHNCGNCVHISFAISAILNQIPVLKKYIV